ncbi:MAG: radical SAM protein [Deltaproteobacteria bacterium HGW-Deltaproteobacteria-9]|nr:MAG: radical SAM protein [Deltaproteobacteria bacterium HGW-Deltaproteobacteria-9]
MTMPLIIPIFIMHRGCPHRCTFCDQQKAAGPYPDDVSETFFRQTVLSHLQHIKKKPDQVQIAFYGGNFTGMPRQDQTRLLKYAQPFLEAGGVSALRISTRPDCLDKERLDFLKEYGVQIVEIGAQSLVDDVLRRAERGHTAGNVDAAVQLLKANGFEVGVHLMAGMPGDSPEGFARSVARTIAMQPHTVRIHPTLVFTGTPLERDHRNGSYEPLTLDEAVLLCKSALLKFTAAGIPVIRIGLQTTPEMEKRGTVIAGPYHPAFRFLVEASIFFDRAASLLSRGDFQEKAVVFSVCPKEQSAFRGLKNENVRKLQNRFGLSGIRVVPDPAQPAGTLHVHCDI